MPDLLTTAVSWLAAQGNLVLPLLLALAMALGDVRRRRIPNYLTLGGALAGLGYQAGLQGWPGLAEGCLGLLLGFTFLILPYIWGGMGAGDVKALAALGAWLGPRHTLYLFCYMGLAGGLMALIMLWRRGLLKAKIRQGWGVLVNWALCRGHGPAPVPGAQDQTPGLPYGVAMALGMMALLVRGA